MVSFVSMRHTLLLGSMGSTHYHRYFSFGGGCVYHSPLLLEELSDGAAVFLVFAAAPLPRGKAQSTITRIISAMIMKIINPLESFGWSSGFALLTSASMLFVLLTTSARAVLM